VTTPSAAELDGYGMAPDTAPARVPPHNLRAEESLLGAILLRGDTLDDALAEGVTTADFYRPAHGHIWDACWHLVSIDHANPDPVLVADRLNRAGLLPAVGGPATLISLQAHCPATSSAGKYARIVHELAVYRRTIHACTDLAEVLYDVPGDADIPLLERCAEKLHRIAEGLR
jgi:replicative DNA helicase